MILRLVYRINVGGIHGPCRHLFRSENLAALSNPKHEYSISRTVKPPFVKQPTKKVTAQRRTGEFIQRNDPDIFGTGSKDKKDDLERDEGDIAEEEHFHNIPLRCDQLSVKEYASMIQQHLKNKFIKEAIDVLEVRMKNDRVKPDYYIFELLIMGCGHLGYTKKAFQLYNQMRKRNLKINNPVYAALFNSCANSIHPKEALREAQNLRKTMIQRGVQSNEIVANTMIKAFGRCGDIPTAFESVDEMKDKKLQLKVITMNHLLQACCSDQYGFHHSLLVWHKIYQRNMSPNIYSFNLMLGCVRKCEIGDLDTMRSVIQEILTDKTKMPSNANNQNGSKAMKMNEPEAKEVCDQMPNLLAKLPHLGSLVKLSVVKTAGDRLLLLGGMSGFIHEMELLKVRPNVKTFAQLLDCIPATREAEHELIEKMREVRVRADTDFFNLLMKRRILRGDRTGAKLVPEMMDKINLRPDIVTYGVMALDCKTREQAHEFFNILKEKRIRANNAILGAMFKNVRYVRDDEFAADILKYAIQEDIMPNEALLKMANIYKSIRNNYLLENTDESDELRSKYQKFYKTYKKWQTKFNLRGSTMDEVYKRVKPHPWRQFKEEQQTGVEVLKNKKTRHQWKLQHALKKLNPTRLDRMLENDSKPIDSKHLDEESNKKLN